MLLTRPSVGDSWDVDIAPTLGHGGANFVAIPMTIGYSMGTNSPLSILARDDTHRTKEDKQTLHYIRGGCNMQNIMMRRTFWSKL